MDICKVILFDIATIFRPMQWTKEHDDLLVKEVLALDPYSSPKGSTERSNVWDSIAGHLNACSYVKFAVSVSIGKAFSPASPIPGAIPSPTLLAIARKHCGRCSQNTTCC